MVSVMSFSDMRGPPVQGDSEKTSPSFIRDCSGNNDVVFS